MRVRMPPRGTSVAATRSKETGSWPGTSTSSAPSFWPCGDRRLDRRGVDDVGLDAGAVLAGHQHLQVAGGHQRHALAGAEPDVGVGDLGAGRVEADGVEGAEGPFDHGWRLGGALGVVGEAADHEDHALAVLHRRADEAVAGLGGVAGLQAVDAEAELKQRVAVVLPDAVPSVFGLAEIVVLVREVVDQVTGEGDEVVRAHHLAGIGQARGVGEVRDGHAELAGPLGHLLGEGGLAAGEAFGDHDAGVVAGLDDDPLDEIADADLGARLDEHPRAFHRLRVRADQELGFLGDAAVAEGLEEQIERHQLRHRRRRDRLVGILGEEHHAGAVVDDQGLAGFGLEASARRRDQHRGEAEAGDKGFLDHARTPGRSAGAAFGQGLGEARRGVKIYL